MEVYGHLVLVLCMADGIEFTAFNYIKGKDEMK